MLFSILIPTLDNRHEQFSRLYERLNEQINEKFLAKEVEVLYFSDNKQHSLGFKRNKLIEWAKGKFIAFVDDDDNVSDDYVPIICRTIKENPDIDCVGIKGIITFRGKTREYLFIPCNTGNIFRWEAYISDRHII